MKKSTRPLLLVGGGADASDVRYVTGFSAPDPFLFLHTPKKSILLVSILEIGRTRELGPNISAISHADLPKSRSKKRGLDRDACRLLDYAGIRRVAVSPTCPVGIVRSLEKSGVQVSVKPFPLFAERIVKSENEIQCLKDAQRAAVSAMKAARRCLRHSEVDVAGKLRWDGKVLNSERVRSVIEHDLLENGYHADETIVAGGNQGVDPHERGHGPLFAGQSIVIDIFPKSGRHGYWGDITRTVAVGAVEQKLRQQYNAVLAAQKWALGEVKAGADAAAIHAGICRQFEAAGYKTGMIDGFAQGFIHGTGHGVGLDIHEAPSVNPLGGILEAGQVITIEPGLYYRDVGGVRIEDTVVVTESGFDFLASCGKSLRA